MGKDEEILEKIVDNINYINKETFELHLNSNFCINYIEYEHIKTHKKNLLFCMLDRNDNQCLIYDYRGFISLTQYLSRNKFNLIGYYQLLLELANTINSFSNSAFDKNSLILHPKYIYINPDTKEFSFIAIPVSGIGSFENGYRQLFRDLLKTSIASANVYDHVFNLTKLSETKFELADLINYLTYKCSMKTQILNSYFIISALCNISIVALGSVSYIYFFKSNNLFIDILVLISLCILSLLVSSGINLIKTKKNLKTVMMNSELSIQLSEASDLSEIIQSTDEKVFIQEQEMSSIQDNASSVNKTNSNNKIQSIRTGVLDVDSDYQGFEQRTLSPLESQPTGVLLETFKSNPLLVNKTNKAEKFELNKYKVIIGREEESVDIYLRESSVSKIHATIMEKNGEYYLSDQNSSNGTYLNNKRLNKMEEYVLKSGDLIRFSNQEYIFNE